MVIKITNAQLKKLEPLVFDGYIAELVEHCDEAFPHLKKIMGVEPLKQALRQAVNKANEQGFTQRGPVKLYVDLLITLGCAFDTDPQYYWLQNIIRKNKALSQIEQASILYKQVKRYSEFISGENNQLLYQVAEKLNALSIHNVKIYKDSFMSDAQQLLQHIYPEKYELIGSEAIEKLILFSIHKANTQYQFTHVNYVALITVLMFMLGYEFDNDLFCTWAAKNKTLRDNSESPIRNSEILVNRLETRAKAWLFAALNNKHSTNLIDELL